MKQKKWIKKVYRSKYYYSRMLKVMRIKSRQHKIKSELYIIHLQGSFKMKQKIIVRKADGESITERQLYWKMK